MKYLITIIAITTLCFCQKENKVYKEIDGTWSLESVQLFQGDKMVENKDWSLEMVLAVCDYESSSSGDACIGNVFTNEKELKSNFQVNSNKSDDFIILQIADIESIDDALIVSRLNTFSNHLLKVKDLDSNHLVLENDSSSKKEYDGVEYSSIVYHFVK